MKAALCLALALAVAALTWYTATLAPFPSTARDYHRASLEVPRVSRV